MKKEKKKPDNKWSTIVKAPYKRPPRHRFYQIQRLHESFSTRSKACIFEEKKVPYIGIPKEGLSCTFLWK